MVYHTDSFDYVVVVDNEAYDLEISIHTPYEKLEIRPSSFGIVPFVKGETVHIHLDEPRKFTVETDGGLHDALFVLCSHRIEKPADTTICFEKGKVYNVGVLTLKSNDTVYIEEGAVVSGCVYADHCDNISIVGNGIINGACWHLPDSNAHRFFIYAKWCNNVLLKGFTAVDGPSWHVVPAACDHVVIDDMNIMSRIVTGDGIDITSSQDVEIKIALSVPQTTVSASNPNNARRERKAYAGGACGENTALCWARPWQQRLSGARCWAWRSRRRVAMQMPRAWKGCGLIPE